MKRILTILIFAGAALAQNAAQTVPPKTIKVRTGFDKKRRPIYTTAEVRTGQLIDINRSHGTYWTWSGHALQDVGPNVICYGINGIESLYDACTNGAVVSVSTTPFVENDEVSYAILDHAPYVLCPTGKVLYLIPPAALAQGIVNDWPLNVLSISPRLTEWKIPANKPQAKLE